MSRPDDLFNLPWQEFRDKYSEAVNLTDCPLIEPKPEHNHRAAWEDVQYQQREIYRLKQAFESGDNLAGISAYLFVYEYRYSLPGWIADWLYSALASFHESNGKNHDLRKLLGIETRQKAGTYAIEQNNRRDFEIFCQIRNLKYLTGFGVDKCCEILSCYKDSGDTLFFGFNNLAPASINYSLSWKTIKGIYEKWKKGKGIKEKSLKNMAPVWQSDDDSLFIEPFRQAMIDAVKETAKDKKGGRTFSEKDRLLIWEKYPSLQMQPPLITDVDDVEFDAHISRLVDDMPLLPPELDEGMDYVVNKPPRSGVAVIQPPPSHPSDKTPHK